MEFIRKVLSPLFFTDITITEVDVLVLLDKIASNLGVKIAFFIDTLQENFELPTQALIVVFPCFLAVTFPVDDTLAIELLSLDHLIF